MTQISLREIKNCINNMSYSFRQNPNNSSRIIASNYKLVDELMSTMAPIKCNENLVRTIWLHKDRGTFKENFPNLEENIENGEFNSKKDAQEYFNECYTYEADWFKLCTKEEIVRGIKYQVITLDDEMLIYLDRSEPIYEDAWNVFDLSDILNWLIEETKKAIQMVKNGTYDEYVNNNIVPQVRTGKILRKDFFDICPEEREAFFETLSKNDIDEFCKYVEEQLENKDKIVGTEKLCAHDFYVACSLGYKANNYEGIDKTPKEQYYLNADGRDEGLGEIDEYSYEAFDDWYENREERGGHPWEVCRGGNSTHIALCVYKENGRYSYYLSGSSYIRTIETVKIYLALKRAGYFVILGDAEQLSLRLKEQDYIGIVPRNVFPRYCSEYFPNENIIDYMNLPYEDEDKFAEKAIWQPVKKVVLVSDGDN